MQLSGKRYSFQKLRLASGPMNANGAVEVGAGGELAGRLNAELGSKGVVLARGGLTVTGTLKNPLLKP
jgi:hypothetical protein